MTTVIVTVFEAAGLTVSEKKIETLLPRALKRASPGSPLVIESARPEESTDDPVIING